MPGRVYCTYFDHNYLARGLALYQSLQAHAPDARLWVLCLSETCFEILTTLNLPNVVPVSMAGFEATDPELAATKSTRKTVEYYFTCTPGWMIYVADREPTADWVTYLDGDMFFFSSPDPIYDELASASIAIIPHRYPHKIRRLKKFGTYNVGWVGARTNAAGAEILAWWRARCIEWCYDYVDGSRFADQGYLDEFPRLSSGVKSIDHPGANLAPWNVANYDIGFYDGKVYINRTNELIFFHFQGLRKAFGKYFFDSHRFYRAPFSQVIRDRIYIPYVKFWVAMEAVVQSHLQQVQRPQLRSSSPNMLVATKNAIQRSVATLLQILSIATGRAIRIEDKKD